MRFLLVPLHLKKNVTPFQGSIGLYRCLIFIRGAALGWYVAALSDEQNKPTFWGYAAIQYEH